jgi:hypothetical protein
MLKRLLIVDLAIAAFALTFWLLKRSLTVYDFGNALSTVGLLAIALGCLSLSFSWELKKPKPRQDHPADLQNRFLRRYLDLSEANIFLFTMLPSGLLAVMIGWLLAALASL